MRRKKRELSKVKQGQAERVCAIIEDVYGLSRETWMFNRNNHKYKAQSFSYLMPRQAFSYLLAHELGWKDTDIQDASGDPKAITTIDHATVRHHRRKIDQLVTCGHGSAHLWPVLEAIKRVKEIRL